MKIDATRRGQMPAVPAPEPFAPAGSAVRGWKVILPGGRPLATPAVADGRVFLGGGWGGYEFYALDAATGGLRWQYQTEDDGPTAAAVWEDFVAFNTESCELEVLTRDGRRVWKKWLGDPLLSMPALDAGRVFMAFPDAKAGQHQLACFRLDSGDEVWRQPIPGEVITCPVLAAGRVHLTTLDGTLLCFEQDTGAPAWREPKNATSSPTVWEGECYFSRRAEEVRQHAGRAEAQQMETLSGRGPLPVSPTRTFHGTTRDADYLDHAKRAARSPHYGHTHHLDAAVGFGGAKGGAKIEQAMANLGHGHVSAVWAYQGSKPFAHRGRLFSGLGDQVVCVDPRTEAVHWKRHVGRAAAADELLDGVLTPPATVNGKLFVGTVFGDVLCLDAGSGEVVWRVELGEPVVFQPAVVGGRVYVPTATGSLVALETGDPGDDGWHMWGATAAHNGLPV